MANLYRKSVLDRLLSPEQLDKLIVVASPSTWIAISGAVFVIIVVLIWSIFGVLPQKVDANGILVDDGGTYSIYSSVSGNVSSVNIAVGQAVAEGENIITISQTDDSIDAISQLNARIKTVEAMTLESDGGTITQDTQELANIKNQISSLTEQLQKDELLLAQYQEQYSTQNKETQELLQILEQKKSAYYSALETGQTTVYQTEVTDTQSNYTHKMSYYESAVSTYINALSEYKPYVSALLSALEITDFNSYLTAKGINNANQVLNNSISAIDNSIRDASSDISAATYADTLKSIAENYDSWVSSQGVNSTLSSSMSSIWLRIKTAQERVNVTKEEMQVAKQAYENAKTNYENYTKQQNTLSAAQQIASNEYSSAQQNYSAANSALQSLEQNISSVKSQIETDKLSISTQTNTYEKQFEQAKQAKLSSLYDNLEGYLTDAEKTQSVSPYAGIIESVKVNYGTIVGNGTELATVRLLNNDEDVVMLYIPVANGKSIEVGMQAKVYASTVDKQEYGHMEGEIVQVDSYITSSDDIATQLGDASLVNYFTSGGPVVRVLCRLKKDNSTQSGYFWSNSKGATVSLQRGTIMTADIITDEKAPITLVIPFLKDLFTIDIETDRS